MSVGTTEMDEWVRNCWQWFALALLLLVPLDLLTTLFAVAQHGIGVETNPVVRMLLEQGLVAVVAVNLLVVVLAAAMFDGVVDAVRSAPTTYRTALVYGVHAWLGLALTTGVVLVANNLLAIL